MNMNTGCGTLSQKWENCHECVLCGQVAFDLNLQLVYVEESTGSNKCGCGMHNN